MVRCDLILVFPVLLIHVDIKPHIKFQVATVIGTLKSTSYKMLT